MLVKLTSGPYVRTIPHFLQMIIDKKVTTIVMLTKLKETQKDPQNGKNIHLVKASFLHDIIILGRGFSIWQDNEGSLNYHVNTDINTFGSKNSCLNDPDYDVGLKRLFLSN